MIMNTKEELVKSLELFNRGFKKCGNCKNILELANFAFDKNRRFQLGPYCRDCLRLKDSEYREKCRIKNSNSNINYNKINKYCSKCKKTKNGLEFSKCKSMPDGLMGWCKICRDKFSRGSLQTIKKWRDKNKDKIKSNRDRYRKLLKEEILSHYGRSCVCCGEDFEPFLTIDHIYGNGSEERKLTNGGGFWTFGRFLRKGGFPAEYQILCLNCNMYKGQKEKCGCPYGRINNG